jgi:hypothetical protein
MAANPSPSSAVNLNLANLGLSPFQRVVKKPSEAENEMWQDYDKYEAGFSAGDHVSDDGARRKIEEEMDMMGIWDAVELGRQLDAELDGTPDLAREDDSLLAEVLAGE